MRNVSRAKIINTEEVKTLRYPLPRGWREAMGILKGKKILDPLRYQHKIRREWEQRLKKYPA